MKEIAIKLNLKTTTEGSRKSLNQFKTKYIGKDEKTNSTTFYSFKLLASMVDYINSLYDVIVYEDENEVEIRCKLILDENVNMHTLFMHILLNYSDLDITLAEAPYNYFMDQNNVICTEYIYADKKESQAEYKTNTEEGKKFFCNIIGKQCKGCTEDERNCYITKRFKLIDNFSNDNINIHREVIEESFKDNNKYILKYFDGKLIYEERFDTNNKKTTIKIYDMYSGKLVTTEEQFDEADKLSVYINSKLFSVREYMSNTDRRIKRYWKADSNLYTEFKYLWDTDLILETKDGRENDLNNYTLETRDYDHLKRIISIITGEVQHGELVVYEVKKYKYISDKSNDYTSILNSYSSDGSTVIESVEEEVTFHENTDYKKSVIITEKDNSGKIVKKTFTEYPELSTLIHHTKIYEYKYDEECITRELVEETITNRKIEGYSENINDIACYRSQVGGFDRYETHTNVENYQTRDLCITSKRNGLVNTYTIGPKEDGTTFVSGTVIEKKIGIDRDTDTVITKYVADDVLITEKITMEVQRRRRKYNEKRYR